MKYPEMIMITLRVADKINETDRGMDGELGKKYPPKQAFKIWVSTVIGPAYIALSITDALEGVGARILWPGDVCEWRYDEARDCYVTTCGTEWLGQRDEGPHQQSDFKHCPKCGLPIKEAE